MSAPSSAPPSVAIVDARSSPTRMFATTSAPAACAAAVSAGALASRIWPGSSSGPGDTSSSPVLTSAIRGRRTTTGRAMLTAASAPISAEPSSVPACRIVSPLRMSSPA